MTIAAAFVCRDGVVLCADTEETRGEMKFQAPKLAVRPKGSEPSKRRAVFVGAGESAFIDKLIEEMWSAGNYADEGIESMAAAMEDACIRVNQRFWNIYPEDIRPEAHIIFGIAEGGGTRVYKATKCLVNRVDSYELTGCGDPLARYIASRAETNPTVKEAIALSIYMLAETKKFVAGCGGDSHVACLHADGSYEMVGEERVAGTAIALAALNGEFFKLLGPVTDEEMSEREFEAYLKSTVEYVRWLRKANAGIFTSMKAVVAVAGAALNRPKKPKPLS